MVLALNRPVTAELAGELAERFIELVIAPEYEDGALEALRAKPAIRILRDRERRRGDLGERDYKRVIGGLLVQDGDREIDDRSGMALVCGEASEAVWGDLLFAWRVAKHVASNAIVLAKDLQTLGIGGGQTSRVDSVRIAVEKARSTAMTSQAQCWPRTRSSRSPTAAGRARGGRDGDHPAGRREAGRGGRRRRSSRRRNGLHRPPPLPALSQGWRFRPMPREYPTALELVGKTPIVRLQKLAPPGGPELLAKLEYLNPGGSVSRPDRLSSDRGGRAGRPH